MTAKKAPRVATLTLTEGRGGRINVGMAFGPTGFDPSSVAHKTALDFVSSFAEKTNQKPTKVVATDTEGGQHRLTP